MTTELKTFIDITATPERVWQVLTDLSAYPEWNPMVSRAEGVFAVGRRVSLTMPRVHTLIRATQQFTVLEMTPYRRLRWRGRQGRLGMPGLLDADYTLTITPHDGSVRIWEQMRFRGLLVHVVTGSYNRQRVPVHLAMDIALKERAEATPG